MARTYRKAQYDLKTNTPWRRDRAKNQAERFQDVHVFEQPRCSNLLTARHRPPASRHDPRTGSGIRPKRRPRSKTRLRVGWSYSTPTHGFKCPLADFL